MYSIRSDRWRNVGSTYSCWDWGKVKGDSYEDRKSHDKKEHLRPCRLCRETQVLCAYMIIAAGSLDDVL